MIASWLKLTFACFYRLPAHTGKISYDCLLALRHLVLQCSIGRPTQQQFAVVDCTALVFGAWRCRRASSYSSLCCNCRDHVFDHTKLVQKNVQHHRQGKNYTVTTASLRLSSDLQWLIRYLAQGECWPHEATGVSLKFPDSAREWLAYLALHRAALVPQ